ncbi:MAG: 2-dehydropantoate 2-reductase [Tepidanaerobacteraceae bacterium]|nr:2-dehydropantoate 2-reductase [Tepidanaerobacteraceae bacterium]
MNIFVVGAGAMGCLFGGLLKLNGHDVTLIDVSQIQVDTINSNGLMIETDTGPKRVRIPARYASEVEEKAELILVFTKTYHTEEAMKSIRHLIGDNTYILTLQNGLGNLEKINKFVELSKIIIGMTNHPSDMVAPGHIRSIGKGKSKIMSADGKTHHMLGAVCKAFNEAGLPCEISPDIFCDIWEKVAFNVSLNSIGAATYLTNGGIASVPEGVELAKKVVEEVIMVANKKGIRAKQERVIAAVENALANHPNHKSSMLQDILAKRPTEIDSLNGAVAREAKTIGLSIPVTETLYCLVKIQEKTYGSQASAEIQR